MLYDTGMKSNHFDNLFTNALIEKPLLPVGATETIFIGTLYDILPSTEGKIPTIMSGGSVLAGSRYRVRLWKLPVRMFLYTKHGEGVLKYQSNTYQLQEGTLLYFNCAFPDSFRVEAVEGEWEYDVFFASGTAFDFYESSVSFTGAVLLPLTNYSPIRGDIDRLLSQDKSALLRNKLIDANIITDIMTRLWLEAFDMEQTEQKIPRYLQDMKQTFDMFFAKAFSLDDLESRYRLSKYKICRDFSNCYGMPPLKYLNHRRIEVSKTLLLTTDMKIHEIAAQVGYENTNHFITLFKKETDMTPLAYRETSYNR